MRIIAGEHRGRKLLAPVDEATRPITDRAKQSLFDVLTPIIAETGVLDVFSGTGSMGLECLSRGAAWTTFFERHPPAVEMLKKNVAALGVGNRAYVASGDILKPGASVRPAAHFGGEIGLIFLDPPYRYLREQPGPLQELAGRLRAVAAAEAVLCFRHDEADALALSGWAPFRTLKYGGMVIELLTQGDQRDSEGAKDDSRL
jgi:16S rRNA (guanine966-N2)-methyltransferase